MQAGRNPGAGFRRNAVIETGAWTHSATCAETTAGTDHGARTNRRATPNLGLGIYQGTGTDLRALGQGHPGTQVRSGTNQGTGIKRRAAADGGTLSDGDVLADLGAVADSDRPIGSAPLRRRTRDVAFTHVGMGARLDTIAYPSAVTDIRGLREHAIVTDASAAVDDGASADSTAAADGGARHENRLVAQGSTGIETGRRPHDGMATDAAASADNGIAPDLRAGLDDGAGTDDGTGTDDRIVSDASAWSDPGRRMNTRPVRGRPRRRNASHVGSGEKLVGCP